MLLLRRAERCGLALLALASTLALAPAAWGHSTLVSTEPARDNIVEHSPERVLLRFDEPVDTAVGSIAVYDGDGERVDAGKILRPRPEHVAVAIDRRLERGTYTVAWRAISADSDPINGAWVFHVEAPGPQPSGIAAQVLEDTPFLVSAFYLGGRFLDFTLLLLCAGGTAALAIALRHASTPVRRRLLGVVAVAAAALTVVALVARAKAGRAATATTVAALVLALALVVTPGLSGHASVSGPVSVVADAAHVQAAAVWTGGLAFVVLALLLTRDKRWELAATSVPRFSTMAVVSVAVLLVAGTINGYLQVRAWRGLWETEYGVLLLVKLGLVLPLLALGAYNNRFAVPRLRAQIASVVERRRFLRTAGVELAIMVAVVGVTAGLVNAPPARTAIEMH